MHARNVSLGVLELPSGDRPRARAPSVGGIASPPCALPTTGYRGGMATTTAHLAGLNPAQRAAATFGVPEGGPAAPGPPLLVVAGAGTGKTGTLAHRVAHLVLAGANPRRVLLLTFTDRKSVV